MTRLLPGGDGVSAMTTVEIARWAAGGGVLPRPTARTRRPGRRKA